MNTGVSLEAVGPASAGLAPKVCLGCGLSKEYSEFHHQKSSPDGYRPRCKQCRKASSRAYYEDNADAIKKRVSSWRTANREQYLEYGRQYRSDPKNRAHKAELDGRYYQQHREDILAYNKTPDRRAAHRVNAKYQKAKRKAAIESTIEPITAEQWQEIQASYLLLCVYCLEKCDDLTMDHVVALNRGGDHTAGNVVPACRKCNREKTDKSVIVFLAERPITAQPIRGGPWGSPHEDQKNDTQH